METIILTDKQKTDLNIFMLKLNDVFKMLKNEYFEHYYSNPICLTITDQIVIFKTLDRIIFKIPNLFTNYKYDLEYYSYFGEDNTDGFEQNNVLTEIFSKVAVTNSITGHIFLDEYFGGFKRLLKDYIDKLSLSNAEKDFIRDLSFEVDRFKTFLENSTFETLNHTKLFNNLSEIIDR